MKTVKEKIVSIQHLRAIAAIAVIGAHTFWGFGDIGVDIFFVISGFIMFYIIDLNPKKNPITFFFDRYFRIAPLYYLFTILFVWFGFAKVTSVHQIIQSLSFVKYYETSPLLNIGWTLEYEFAFYSMCCLGLLFFKNKTHRKYFIASLLLVFFIFFDILIYHEKIYGHFLEFLFGIIVYELYQRNKLLILNIYLKIICFIILLALLLSSHYLYSSIDIHYLRFLGFGLPSALILYLSLSFEKNWPASKILNLLGNSSYSIYITHTFFLINYYNFFDISRNESLFFEILAFFSSIFFGVMTYYLIEKPSILFFKKIRKKFSSNFWPKF
tara:strand:- start:6698 stop:7678 length:981 start_codon:yes stop_codon:yes gene_type:complete